MKSSQRSPPVKIREVLVIGGDLDILTLGNERSDAKITDQVQHLILLRTD